jgi:hypothetical protein
MISSRTRFTRQALGLLGAILISAPTIAAAQVGVSVSINQPGFYGRVDIGEQRPVLLYPQPVIIQQSPVAVMQRPIYMRVPPGHSKNWARYCAQYRACGQPVYFVSPQQPQPPHGRDERHDDHHEDHRDGRGDRDDRGGDHGRGHGRGHGNGHGH